tara:strand:- start:1290 stop:1655 length:366 start_codon:yes stop_codon:yes gene_type:complete
MDYIAILQVCALVAIAAGLWRKVDRSVTVNVPEVKIPAPPPAQIKILMPADIQRVAMESGRVRVEHRQPDGTWHEIGGFQVQSEGDQSTWPQRVFDELKSDGRRLVFPSGRIIETAEEAGV